MNEVARDKVDRRNALLRAVTKDDDIRWEHVLDGLHDTRCAEVLPCVEERLKYNHNQKYNGQCEVGGLWIRLTKRLPIFQDRLRWIGVRMKIDVPGDEADDAGRKKQATKAAKHPPQDLPKHVRLGRCDRVLAVGRDASRNLRSVQANIRGNRQTLQGLPHRNLVPVQSRDVYR